MVAERLLDLEHDALGFVVGEVGIVGGDLEFADDAADGKVQRLGTLISGILLFVLDVEQLVRGTAGMKGEAQ